MRSFVVALLAATTFEIGAAAAADLPVRAPPAPVYSPVSAYNWTGLYVGVNVGYGWATATSTATVLGVSATGSEKLDGVIGGGQIGYNWQAGNIVLGIEGDFQGSGQSHTTTLPAPLVTLTEKDQINWFGTVRGRLGYAANNWMPYITGGWGYGEFESTLTATGALVGTLSNTTDHGFWVVGGGVEAALMGKWTWKAEYLYMDTGSFTTNSTILGIPITTTNRAKDNIARLGLNYRF